MGIVRPALLSLLALSLQAQTYIPYYNATCTNQQYGGLNFAFMPVPIGVAFPKDGTTNIQFYGGLCFTQIQAHVTFEHEEGQIQNTIKAHITMKLDMARSTLCSEAFLIGNTFDAEQITFYQTGTTKFTKEFQTRQDVADINLHGLRINAICVDTMNMLASSVATAKMVMGGMARIPYLPIVGEGFAEPQRQENMEFLYQHMGKRDFDKRVIKNVEIAEVNFLNGDLLMLSRFDGIEPVSMVATGSHVGHAAMTLWDSEELYVVEALDGWQYSKDIDGVQFHLYKDWIAKQHQSGFSVIWLPLREEYSDMIYAQDLWEWIDAKYGSPFDFSGWAYSFLDSEEDNYFSPFFQNTILQMLEEYKKFATDYAYKQTVLDPFNRRLRQLEKEKGRVPSKTCEDLGCIMIQAAGLSTNLYAIMAMPAQDVWQDPNMPIYTSASFIVEIYKHIGVFGKLKINASEFHLRDLYQLDIFHRTIKEQELLPLQCHVADPHLPYCQLMGEYRVNLPGYSTVKPYDNMNEKCKSHPPLYEREPTNC